MLANVCRASGLLHSGSLNNNSDAHTDGGAGDHLTWDERNVDHEHSRIA